MKITDEQLSKLREKLGDKELKEIGIELPKIEFSNHKIYAFKGSGKDIWKLNNSRGKFTWNCVDSTNNSLLSSEEIDFEYAFKLVKCWEVKEFSNTIDFANWILTVNK